MGASRIVILVVAAFSAVVLMFVVRGMVGHKAAPPPPVAVGAPAKPISQVLVAHRDLPIGTRLAAGDIAWQPWPADAVNPAFITDGAAKLPPTTAAGVVSAQVAGAGEALTGSAMEAFYGAIVREPILANEPIVPSKLVRGGEGGYMAVVLNPGDRAMAVPVTVATAAGGFILPGDRVDVLQSHAADVSNGGKPGFVAETLLRNIRVLAIDQASTPPKGAQSMIGAVATLEVASGDAEVMAKAKAQGDIILALRAYSDAGGHSGRGAGGPENTGDVRIFRNGQVSDVMVAP
jgi:pilus assembly protein CpaB